MPNRKAECYHDGFEDHLTPLESLDLNKVNDFDEMLGAMSLTSFGSRCLGQAAYTLYQMITDPDTFVVLTLSGAMTPAKMGLIICDLIDRGFVQAIVSTGALMTHGFVESSGRLHFKHNPKIPDEKLYEAGYNRIYDTLELEKNLDDIEVIINEVLNDVEPGTILSSRKITFLLGRWLEKNTKGPGILKSADKQNVPVYVPAFTDSELGLDVALYNRRCIAEGKDSFQFNPFHDLEHYAELINQQKKLGIFTIGGGVPRNWAQQVAPYLDLITGRLPKSKTTSHIKSKKFTYGVRICPEPVHWGGLSGCTYSEGVSWGKFESEENGGQQTEVLEDATVVLPIIVKGVIQRLEKNNTALIKNFSLQEQMKKVYELTKTNKLER